MKRQWHHPELEAAPESGRRYWRSIGEIEDTPSFRNWLETEFPHNINRERDEFGIRSRRSLAHDVGIELVELAQAAPLRFLVTEAATDLEPLEGLGIVALLVRNNARERGGQFDRTLKLPLTFCRLLRKICVKNNLRVL